MAWNVTPIKSGGSTLTVKLTAPAIVDGRETGYEIAKFVKAVTVTFTTEHRVGDALSWPKDNWTVLTGLVGALGVLAPGLSDHGHIAAEY